MTTLNDTRDPARICRANGWKVGQCLVGEDDLGPITIEITAIDERLLLAKQLPNCREATWALDCRDWRPC
jgi:hypothetical protein